MWNYIGRQDEVVRIARIDFFFFLKSKIDWLHCVETDADGGEQRRLVHDELEGDFILFLIFWYFPANMIQQNEKLSVIS